MAILGSHGILLVNSIPLHTPTADQAHLARLQNTMNFWVWNGTDTWLELELQRPTTFTGSIIPDNSDLGEALQALETALDGITSDGNDTPFTRGNATEDVEPTVGEVPSPVSGDTATILLSNGLVEKWLYTSSWAKAFVIDHNDTANLGYTPSPTNGIVTNTNGDDATLTLVDGTNAGLMSPSMLSQLTTAAGQAATALQTTTDGNSIDFTVAGTDVTAEVIVSAANAGNVVLTVEADGLSAQYDETEPPTKDSRAQATTDLGAGAKFQYTAANLDGAVQGVVAWT